MVTGEASVTNSPQSLARIQDERLLREPRRSGDLRRSPEDFRLSTASLAVDFGTSVDAASVVLSIVRRDVDRRTGSSRFSIRAISSGGRAVGLAFHTPHMG